jgi:hypothetical protein
MATTSFAAPRPFPAAALAQDLSTGLVEAAGGAFAGLFAIPFDTLRAQYAGAVKAGLVERSMLAARDFERAVSAMEQLTLGPLARRR